MLDFAEHLRELRKSRNITQKQLATEINVAERNYQSFEYGKVKPSFDNLIILADYFNVSLDYLVGRSDNPEINR